MLSWCAWRNTWANNRDAGDLINHRAHYDVTIMCRRLFCGFNIESGTALVFAALKVILLNVMWCYSEPCFNATQIYFPMYSHMNVTSNSTGFFFNNCFRLSTKKRSNLYTNTGSFWIHHPPVTVGFPPQRATNAESISIWWQYHVWDKMDRIKWYPRKTCSNKIQTPFKSNKLHSKSPFHWKKIAK